MIDLAQRYKEACATRSDIHEHLPTMVDLVRDLQAMTVIELGTRGGVSTIAWLYALAETGGHLWSVDIDPQPVAFPTVQAWTFVRGDDCDPDTYTRLPTVADIVFIDTSHAYEHTHRELALYRWLVRPGGRIVLHDTELAHPVGVGPQPLYPVKKAITEFCEAEGLTWVNYPNNNGLGVIHV